MAGLMLGVFASLERRRVALAALLVCLGFYVKIFGAAAAILFLFYDRKWGFLVWSIGIGLALLLLPLPLIGHDGFINQYQSWFSLLKGDTSHEMNLSLATVIERWTGFMPPNGAVLIPAFVLLAAPLIRPDVRNSAAARLLYAGGLLIWVVIFNHKAESPTYIIAATGIALWGLVEPPSRARMAMLVIAFVLTGLSHGDLFPEFVRDKIIWRYGLKAVPSIVIWGWLTWRLIGGNPGAWSTRYLAAVSGPGTSANVPPA